MRKIAVVLSVIFSLALAASAQRAARTVTNADLAKFRDKRVAAERDLRDNYAALGFPSPEELEAMRDRDMAERLELAEQLRQARLEKEKLELDRARLDLDSQRLDLEREASVADAGYGNFGYPAYHGYGYGGFGGFGFGKFGSFGHRRSFGFPLTYRYPRNRLLPVFSVPTYRATPGGVVRSNENIMPTPVPVFRGSRGGRRR